MLRILRKNEIRKIKNKERINVINHFAVDDKQLTYYEEYNGDLDNYGNDGKGFMLWFPQEIMCGKV